jgi:hypothetical protein
MKDLFFFSQHLRCFCNSFGYRQAKISMLILAVHTTAKETRMQKIDAADQASPGEGCVLVGMRGLLKNNPNAQETGC